MTRRALQHAAFRALPTGAIWCDDAPVTARPEIEQITEARRRASDPVAPIRQVFPDDRSRADDWRGLGLGAAAGLAILGALAWAWGA